VNKKLQNLSLQDMKRLAIAKQQLTGSLPSNPSRDHIYRIVQELAYLQIDPISAVAPSHRLVLWSRLGKYKLDDLDYLLWKERKIFEYFGHAASIVLTEDYPIHYARMRAYVTGDGIPESWHLRIQSWMKRNNALRLHILKELRRKGPLASREIEDKSERPWRSAGWTNQRNVSRMLDFLLAQGKVMIAGRSGSQKLWDLAERCLPPWTPRTRLSYYEVDRLAMEKSLRALGVATQKQIITHFASGRYTDPSKVLNDLESEGIISPVDIEGLKNGRKAYVHCKDLRILDQLQGDSFEPRTTLLSPFDNLIIDRERTNFLFRFEMSFEIYVPKKLRKFGYYVLPILQGDNLVGRIDPFMYRKNSTLLINAVYAEKFAPKTKESGQAVALAIEGLADFLGAKNVSYSTKVPEFWKSQLK
jgi:uncharacterized protein